MPITTIVIRAVALTALATPLLSIATQAKPTQAKPDCAALIVSTPLLKETDFMGKLPRPFSEPSRDMQYESAKAFAARVNMAKKAHQAKTAEQMAGQNLVFKMMTGGPWITYNPDRGGFEAKFGVLPAASRKDGKQVPFPAVSEAASEGTTSRNIGLGAKSVLSRHYGLAFVKSAVKHPFITGKQSEFFFKYPVEKARAVGSGARLAFIGVVQEPWSFESYSSWTDFDAMKDQSLSTSYAAVNLICAAVVDGSGNRILHEFK